ncbi:transporter substrate-binding domain-containing protein [Nocardiopsis lambiniae]|uniref:Transporter substrate-binding domain-containing protein n=1 Tax=Nocardiopsis lambiniae TaxID=3075539 RepID=A0ABU2MCH3_9ACTN|nr:transporter substrate-binding domain-containing protein [Nocardiopsis sp. DSM 44743]MDT0329825.1 transporter substrate-binding domain-containing protein [Nocardiopsis sp. DSM 44743]
MTTRTRGLAATALLALMATACGGSDGEGAAEAFGPVTVEGVGSVEPDPELVEGLPAHIRDAGRVAVATNAPYEPFIAFVEEGNQEDFTGLDHDLMVAASAKLGLDTDFQQQPFDGLVPGLQAGRYDVIVGGITDNRERQEVASFVDYTASGTGVLVADGNPLGIGSIADLCGLRVGVQQASRQQEILEGFAAEECDEPIEITDYPENPQAVTALKAGMVDAVAATQVNLVEIAASLEGEAELVIDPENPNGYLASPNGFGFLKGEEELVESYRAAVQSLIDDGTYTEILAKWGQEPIALDEATVNQAID